MPSFIKPARPSWPALREERRRGPNSDLLGGEGRRQRQASAGRKSTPALSARNEDLRQQTLTQIDFVRRLSFPPDDLNDLQLETLDPEPEPEPAADARRSLSRKRRRIQTRPEEEPRILSNNLHQKANLSSPRPEYSPAFTDIEASIAHSNQNSNEVVPLLRPPSSPLSEMQDPRTPARRGRTVVPSSQSPDATPLSIRTVRTNRQEQLKSPLRQRKDANPLLRDSPSKSLRKKTPQFLRRTTIPETQENEDDALVLAEDSEDAGDSVRPLRYDSPASPQLPTQRVTSRLDASPDVAHKKGTRQTAGMLPPPVVPSQPTLRSSQMPTQDPTQIPDSLAALYRLDQRPSSQITTQAPTQMSDSGPLPPTPPRFKIKSEPTTQEPAQDARPSVSLKRIHSSQATTVLPSSDPITPTPQAKRQWATPPIKEEERAPSPSEDPFSPARNKYAEWEWDGKELTDSQLYPESLLNWSIPLPSSMSSDHTTHEDEEVTRPTPRATHSAATRKKPADSVRVKDEPIFDEEPTKASLPRARARKRGKVNRGIRIKDEPVD